MRPSTPMMIRYSATMKLSRRGMKRIRIPAMSATIGAMAIPMNMRSGFLFALARILQVAARFLDGLAGLGKSTVGFAAGFFHRPAAFAVVAAAAGEGHGKRDGDQAGSHPKNCARGPRPPV